GHPHNEPGCRYKDDLQDPEANKGDREGTVIADCLAARLVSVADELCLLVLPYILGSRSQDQHAEDEEYGKPDFAHNGGMNSPMVCCSPLHCHMSSGCVKHRQNT
uniref:Uncharacterized protein n=1 Tax=Myripristis murdjan TaxID=586833 RepID=A0A667XP14_9TELE